MIGPLQSEISNQVLLLHRAAHVKTYCSCTPGLLLCPECYTEHKVDASMANIVHV